MNSAPARRSPLFFIVAGLNVLVIGSLVLGSTLLPGAPAAASTRTLTWKSPTPMSAPAAVHQPTPWDAFLALQARAGVPLHAQWDPVTGIPEFLTPGDPSRRLPYTPTAAERGNAVAIARGFLDENRALFRLGSAMEELTLLRIEPDLQLNYAHVRLNQTYKGLPVFGRQLVVHLDPQLEGIVAVNGQYAPGIAVETQPVLTKAEAERLAVDDLLLNQLTPSEAERAAIEVYKHRTALTIYVDDKNKATLTWRVKILSKSPLGEWDFFVNARRPVVVHQVQFSHPVMRRKTYSARNSTNIPGRLVIDEGQRSSDPIAQAAHDGAAKVYEYYWSKFKRDSIDGRGLPLVSTVNYGSDPSDAENAAWIGEAQQMIYGDGGRIFRPLPYGLDVVGHEFTHGVINSTADLIYEGQSGALNESYADVFGALIDRGNWAIGEQVVKSPPFPTRMLRSLEDPTLGGRYDPRNPLAGVGQPRTMREYANLPISRRADNGGVHINSGIPNHAAYLLASAIGLEKMEQIYYRALTQYLTPRSNFLQAANATVRAAADLYGQAEIDAVRKAFGQVGINVGGSDAAPRPPAEGGPSIPARGGSPAPPGSPQLPAGCTEVVADGGFESGSPWVQESKSPIIDSELAYAGDRSAWLGGTDQETTQIIYQRIRLPANATRVEFSYYRLIHEEMAGGLLGSLFGKPDAARFNVLVANEQGDLLGAIEQLTSEGGDDTWRQARFDVSELAGKTIQLAFSAENPRGNISSFFVDEVSMIACTTGQGPAAPKTSASDLVYLQGTVSDADTGRGIYGAQVFIIKPGLSATQAAADDAVTASEVSAMAVTDQRGFFRTDKPIQSGQTYGVIIIARGYRPIIANDAASIPGNASNPFPLDATMRRSR
ncbi:MAG: M4 family metallopeptidase [Anaerolineae bacterium]|nr:M4 family metallopeptidase [Anaerolineae bacterium]